MKKLFLICLTLLLSLTTLTGCGSTSFSYDKAYWQDDLTAPFEKIDETITYKVSLSNTTAGNKTIVKNDSVSIVLDDESKYVTTFKTSELNSEKKYIYETLLIVKGKYIVDGKETPFSDKTTTVTEFRPIENGFRAIKSVKNCENNTVYYQGKIQNFAYKYSVEYKGSTAYTVYTKIDKTGKETTEKKNYEKYNDGTYIDNDLITLMPRAINLKNVNHTFSTIDVVRKTKVPMKYYGTNKMAQTFEGFEYLKNNNLQTCNMETFGVSISISDKFSGSSIEAYYAKDVEGQSLGNKQKLIKLYTLINEGIGYFEYTMTSVSYN